MGGITCDSYTSLRRSRWVSRVSSRTRTAPLHVLASNGMRAVIDELKPQLERDLDARSQSSCRTTAAIRQRIDAGEAFDVAVLTAEVIDALAKSGKIAPGSVGALGRSGVGVGVRAGAAKPDVATPDAFKRALLATKSVTWVGVGASKPFIEQALDKLGIAAEMKPKIVIARASTSRSRRSRMAKSRWCSR